MRYLRQFSRKNERLHAKQTVSDYRLTRQIISAVTAMGFLVHPFAALSGNITDANGRNYMANNNVYDIYAQKRKGNNAVNQFQTFQLDAGKIANMYFRTQNDTAEAANLLNFVDTRIDINGTLNAIRNKQIGGNLFFLSPEGMVVGKGGVINTGFLYVMAPALTQNYTDGDQRSYAILKGNFASDTYGDAEVAAIKNGAANIRINPSGTISVLGKINATDEVKLYAGKVAVGKNLTGKSIDGTAADGIETDIHVAEDSHLRVGTIKSTDGDVTLTTTGSLIDALPSGETIDRGNTAALVQGWKDLGLIDGEGQYKQKQVADVAAYKAGVQSEFAQYLKLKTAYANKEEAAENDVNYQTLKDRYGNYTSADDYLAKSDTAKNHLSELQKVGAGWTENELLYAISDAIVNKQQGSTDTELKQANIAGRNITLQAKNIGLDKAAEDVLVKDITTDERLDDLNKVVNANVSDVGYTKNDKGENVFRIYGKVPVGIEAKGELNVQSDGNIYVAGRTSGENKDTVLKLGKVTTGNGDIRVLGKAGVTNSLTDGSANLTGKNLILEGGSADIGAADKQIAVDLTGSLSALTDGSMYISSVGSHDLQLTVLYAGKDMVLESQQDITMSPDALAQAYLNAGSLLNLKAQSGIGTEDNALRILGNGAVVDAEAQESSIYLAGKKKTGETDGLLLLGSVKTNPGHAVAVTAETNLSLGKKDDAATLDSQVSADTVSLSSDKDIDLVKGGLTANDLDLKAGGSISQSAAHAITAPTVKLDAVSGIDLVNGAELDKNKVFNDFQNVRVKNGSDAADVNIGSGGSKNLTVSFETGTKGNNVTVHNYQNGTVNDMTVNGPLQAAGSIHLMNAEADLMTAGSLEAVKGDAKVVSESGEILVNGRYVGYSKSDGRQRLHRRFGRCERWRHDPFGNRPQSPGQ